MNKEYEFKGEGEYGEAEYIFEDTETWSFIVCFIWEDKKGERAVLFQVIDASFNSQGCIFLCL